MPIENHVFGQTAKHCLSAIMVRFKNIVIGAVVLVIE
jgi:hypothetical protein